MKRKKLHLGPSAVALSARQRNSAGAMGGTKRTKRRRDRQATKRALRSGGHQ